MSDCIKREDAVKAVDDLSKNYYCTGKEKREYHPHIDFVIEALNQCPSADVVERKRGEWIKTDRTYCGATVYECSACCYEVDEMPTVMGKPRYNYCPSCGAYMRAEQTEPQTYITEDRDTQILDAWQVHHRTSTTAVEDEPQTDCTEALTLLWIKNMVTDEEFYRIDARLKCISCKWWNDTIVGGSECVSKECTYQPKDEPQTERSSE